MEKRLKHNTARIRGRDQYNSFRTAIILLTRLTAILPSALRESIWETIDCRKGKVSLALRYAILKTMAQSCGDVVYVGPYVEIRNWYQLVIGHNVSIQRCCYLDATGGITIGNDVSIAHSTSVLSANHQWGDFTIPIRDNPIIGKRVVVEDDVWIACGCRIMPGVRIGKRSIVAAGAVVTHDVPPGTIVGGVPARVIKYVSPADR